MASSSLPARSLAWAELEQGAGVAGVQLDRLLQVGDGLGPLALGEVAAGELEVVLGVVAALLFELGEDGAGLGDVALLAVDAGPLQLHLAGGVAELLGLLERLEGLVVVLRETEGAAEVVVGQRAFGLLEVLHRLAGVAEEERGDAELEVPVLGDGAGGAFQLLLDDLGHVAERSVLAASLGQAVAELLDGAGVAVLALDQQGLQVNHHRLNHAAVSGNRGVLGDAMDGAGKTAHPCIVRGRNGLV